MSAMTVEPISAGGGPALAPVLAASGIRKSYGAIHALHGVDFEVAPGEVVALVGDNGAGKSTLIKALSGVERPDEGAIAVAGESVDLSGPGASAALGVATVYQDLALCDNLDVVQNLFLGRERKHARTRFLDETAMEHEAISLLQALSVRLRDLRAEVRALSGGQRQAVAIARALIGDPKVVLLDEPTAALGVAQTHEVLELIHRLRAKGLGVVLVSHNLADVFSVSDRITVLRLGRRAATFAVNECTREAVVAAITGVEGGLPPREGRR